MEKDCTGIKGSPSKQMPSLSNSKIAVGLWFQGSSSPGLGASRASEL